jgi:hypothetical protein
MLLESEVSPMTILQTLLVFILICMMLGIIISMVLLTWALIKPAAAVSWQRAGKWMMGFLLGVFICYVLLIVTR